MWEVNYIFMELRYLLNTILLSLSFISSIAINLPHGLISRSGDKEGRIPFDVQRPNCTRVAIEGPQAFTVDGIPHIGLGIFRGREQEVTLTVEFNLRYRTLMTLQHYRLLQWQKTMGISIQQIIEKKKKNSKHLKEYQLSYHNLWSEEQNFMLINNGQSVEKKKKKKFLVEPLFSWWLSV